MDLHFKFTGSACSIMEYVPLSTGCLMMINSECDESLAVEIPFDIMEEIIKHMTRHCKDYGRLK